MYTQNRDVSSSWNSIHFLTFFPFDLTHFRKNPLDEACISPPLKNTKEHELQILLLKKPPDEPFVKVS